MGATRLLGSDGLSAVLRSHILDLKGRASPGPSGATIEPCMLAPGPFIVFFPVHAHRLSVRNLRLLLERSPLAMTAGRRLASEQSAGQAC